MTTESEQKVVLVVGASGGIGKAAAELLLQKGVKVGLHYRSSYAPIEELLRRYGPENSMALNADLTAEGSAKGCVELLASRFGKIDGCLDTIGSALHIQPFLELSDSVVQGTIDVELRSVISLAQAVLPMMIENGGGRFVIVGSDSGKVGTSGEAVSAACRGAVISLAKSLAREYARHNVLFNVVCPGPTDTSLWTDLVENDEFGGKIGAAMLRAIPLRRIGTPLEVAALSVFLLSDEASFITGQAISVSGGLTMS